MTTADIGGVATRTDGSQGRGGLLRQSTLTAAAASASVVSGLLLDVTIATTFGANRTTDAFFVAARLPVFAVTVLMAGAYQSLTPTFAVWAARRPARAAWASTTSVLAIVGAVGVGAGAVLSVSAPVVVRVLAPGLGGSSADVAGDLLRILAVVVPLTALAEALRAVLNAHYSFVAPAGMNVVSNGAAIAVIVVAGSGAGIEVVAWGCVLGACLRLVFVASVARRIGLGRGSRAGSRTRLITDPAALEAVRTCTRPVAAASMPPLARTVEQGFASFLPAGSITILNYGYRLVFAMGGNIFFRSIVATLVPRLTEATVQGQPARVARITGKGVVLVTSIAVPLTVFISTLGVPAALAVFVRGSFSRGDATRLGIVVAILSLALVGEALQRVLLAPFYAALDTGTPLRNACYGAATNLALLPIGALAFSGTYGALFGIAIAFTVSEYVGAAHAWVRLRSRIGAPAVELRSTLRRILPPAAAAGTACVVLSAVLNLTAERPRGVTVALLAATSMAGMAVLVGAMALTCGAELRQVWHAMARRPS